MRRLVSLPLGFMILLFLAPPSSSSASREGCPDRCGSLSIPYPFGVGPGCYMEPSFDVKCNTSTNPPRAYLRIGMSPEIIDINPSTIRVRTMGESIAFSSYDPVEGRNVVYISLTFVDTPYTFSDGNWLTAISCDDVAAVTGIYAGREYSGGCISYCQSRNDSGGIVSCPDSGNGLGSGCCRTPIPRGTNILFVNLTDVHTIWRGKKRRLFHNGYAVIGEKTVFNQSFPLTDLNNNPRGSVEWLIKNTPPVLLDWRIGAQNCSEAQKKTTYACQANTFCADFQSAGGYLCNCSKGYVGNPYLAPGCQDVDECAESTTNPCDSKPVCTNTQGSFTCSCPKGYNDYGKGCIRHSQSKATNVLIGLGAGVGFMLVLATCFVLWKALQKRMKRKKNEKFFVHLLLQHQTNEGTLERTKLFTAKELDKATDNFNSSRIIGEGGQGTVYKGMLSDGKIVAIKKLNRVGEDEVKQLLNEIVILSQINHRNVVKLLGCCLATEIPMLIYEFVLNGTLSHHLRDPNNSLSWKIRLKMAVDIGGALAYLHSGSSIPIYHRDIKSSNILLDENFIVKVADFGISKAAAVDQTHLSCTKPLGTHGYVDPEYAWFGKLTEKSDVYSFGVVLVELLTGEKAISSEGPEAERYLAVRFRAWMDTNALDLMLDARVSGEGGKEEIIAVARIAERCLNIEGKMRPTMREVAAELERISQMRVAAAELEMISQMPSTSTARANEPNPLMISDLSKISEMFSEISEISETV